MEINNLEKIKSLLNFDNPDHFFFLQILKRKKDNPDCANLSNSKVIKTYYVSNLEYLELKFEEIKMLCNSNNARAYINLNTRSYERIAFHMLKELTDRILNKDYKSVSKAYDSACGAYSVGDKKWIIDVDSTFEETMLISNEIQKCTSGFEKIVIDYMPTINGFHVITHPFNLKEIEEFRLIHPFDVQKNNPTILYFNKL